MNLTITSIVPHAYKIIVFVIVACLVACYSRYTALVDTPTQRRFQSVIEEHYPDCTIKVITNSSDLGWYLQAKETCTLNKLKDHFLRFGQFHGDGVWYAPPDGSISERTEFFPKLGHFPNRLKRQGEMRKCVERGVKSILITGDSNGRRATIGLIQNIEAIMGKQYEGYTCDYIRHSDEDPMEYFRTPNVPDKNIVIHPCAFPHKVSCINFQYECSMAWNGSTSETTSAPLTLMIEYIPMFHIIDSGLHLYFSSVSDKIPVSAESQLEFLLKYYFPHRGFPDIWIYKAPFHHEASRHSYEKVELDFRYIFGLFDMYLPSKTKVIFMTAAPECEPKRPKKMDTNFVAVWNTVKNDRMFAMNQLLYRVLEPEVAKRNNFYVFLDAPRMVCPIKCRWHFDGAHLLEPWYAKLGSYLFELACEHTH